MSLGSKENGVRSACCDAPVRWGDICTDCGEHCDVIDDEGEEE